MKGQEIPLFNLGEDVGETKNLAEMYPKIVEKLKTVLKNQNIKINNQQRQIGELD